MLDISDPEDRFIRLLLIGAATAATLLFLAAATAVTVMISLNFNLLDWLE